MWCLCRCEGRRGSQVCDAAVLWVGCKSRRRLQQHWRGDHHQFILQWLRDQTSVVSTNTSHGVGERSTGATSISVTAASCTNPTSNCQTSHSRLCSGLLLLLIAYWALRLHGVNHYDVTWQLCCYTWSAVFPPHSLCCHNPATKSWCQLPIVVLSVVGHKGLTDDNETNFLHINIEQYNHFLLNCNH